MAPGESMSVEFEEPIDLLSDEQPVDALASGTLRVERTDQGVLVRGRVRAEVPLICGRCLVPFRASLGADVREVFSLDPVGGTGGGELSAEDFVSWVGPAQEVDLTELVRQNLQMSLPMAPLHAEDCRGLCPVCGANWNEHTCEHLSAQGAEGEGDP